MSAYRKPLPAVDDLNRPFWEGVRRRELRLLRCEGCGGYRFRSFRLCPKCGGDKATWVETSGKGTIWSYGIFHKAYFEGFKDEVPYNVVLVELAEGPRLYTNLVGARNDQIRIGMPVEAVFEDVTPEVTLVKFKPAG
ncbi:MAG: OB-fold domain-containing protein [Proteobacteria bacterium]|nr:OB-fold domain-containing protein [Pseudomonadota bacterium]